MIQQPELSQLDNIKDEVFQRIDLLASKLGVAAEHLWEVLSRQGIVEGIYGVILLVFGIAVMIIGYKLVKYGVSNTTGVEKDCWGQNHLVFLPQAVASIIGGVFSIIVGLCAFIESLTSAMYLLNPEYFALVEITKLFK